jgi:basic membrane protein A
MRRLLITCIALLLLTGACDDEAVVEGRQRVGVVYGVAGSNDKSFNEAVKFAVTRLTAERRVAYEWREPRDANELEGFLRELAEQGLDVIIAACDPAYLQPVAEDYPEQHFILVGGELALDNVRALSLANRRAGAAVGAIAALKSETGRIGFIGSRSDRTTRRILAGYQEGARIVEPEIEFVIDYLGEAADAEQTNLRARELAAGQYDRGVDVILAYCGREVEVVAAVAAERDAFIIGSDLNQNWIEKGHVLTSMMRSVSPAVEEALAAALDGRFEPGLVQVPLGGEHGLGYYLDEVNRGLLPPRTRQTVEEVFERLEAAPNEIPPDAAAPEPLS